jgi:hypothetical protein
VRFFSFRDATVLITAGLVSGCAGQPPFSRNLQARPLTERAFATSALPQAPLSSDDLQEYFGTDDMPSVATGTVRGALGTVAGATVGAVAGAVVPGTARATGSASSYSYATENLYDLTPVEGDRSVRRFYYIRQDHYIALVPPGTNPAVLETYETFGPHPVGAAVNTRIGFNYFFFPVCGNRFAADHAVEIRADEPPPTLKLTCLR